MRREYQMSDHEFWHELSLPRLMMMMRLRTERMMPPEPGENTIEKEQIAIAAGL